MEEDLGRKIVDLSRAQGISMNKLIKRLLRQSLSLPLQSSNGTDLSLIQGTMTQEEGNNFDEALKEFDRVDEESWL